MAGKLLKMVAVAAKWCTMLLNSKMVGKWLKTGVVISNNNEHGTAQSLTVWFLICGRRPLAKRLSLAKDTEFGGPGESV